MKRSGGPLTELGWEFFKTLITLLVFIAIVVWSVCDARAGEDWKTRPVCSIPAAVYTAKTAPPALVSIATRVTRFYNRAAGIRVVKDGGQIAMEYNDGDIPGFIGIRVAPLDMVQAWRELNPPRVAWATNSLNQAQTCVVGTAIWIDMSCVVKNKRFATRGCRTMEQIAKSVLHEVGHALGLPHSEQSATAMFNPSSLMGRKWVLGKDTRKLMAWLYHRPRQRAWYHIVREVPHVNLQLEEGWVIDDSATRKARKDLE